MTAMLQVMDTFTRRNTARSQPERPPNNPAGELLFDRASVDAIECRESGWDEWDVCVAEQDLRLERARRLH